MQQWNDIFKKRGKVFTKVQEDILKIATIFKKYQAKKILDLGCGSGRHTIYFAKRGYDVYGIDMAKEGISITRSWLKKENLKADLKIGNIYDKLPYPNDFFDAIISTGTINHNKIKNIRKTIKELERVLKPKGLIFITVRKNKKFKKRGPKSTIILWFGKEKIRCKIIGPRTCIPMEGGEKGLMHYIFNKGLLRREFKNFKNDIWFDSSRKHCCLLGKLKS